MTQQFYTSHAQYVRHQRAAAPNRSAHTTLKALILLALSYLIFIVNPQITLSLGKWSTGLSGEPDALAGVIVPVKGKAKVKDSPKESQKAKPVARPAAMRNEQPEKELLSRDEKYRDYINRYLPIAQAEQRKYGIPASIIMAQALLESNAGQSRLARNSNNHFGIKCFARKCKRGHCTNHTDDSHKDFFVNYGNVWGSYRAHSQFLRNSARYAHLFRLPSSNYKAWAHGLEKAGYATNKQYGESLVRVIESYGLHKV